MNILRFLPFMALAALVLSAPAPVLAQNDPMGAGSFSGGNGSDIETLANTELMETSQDSEDDLKDQMRKVKEQNEKKKAQREAAARMKESKKKLHGQTQGGSAEDATEKVMLEKSKNAHGDLQGQATSLKGINDKKKAARENKDSLSELGEQQSERMEEAQDRMEKADTAASRMMEKSSDTNANIIGNMK